MDWIVRYYWNDTCISSRIIENRTEKEAENEAIALMDTECNDWTLTERERSENK